MSALDMLIRRLMAQRACLDRAAELVRPLSGPLLQLGFGDGSAYDHLSELLRGRDIVVFDRVPIAREHLPPQRLALGEWHETLATAWDHLQRQAVLAHVNLPVTTTPRLAADITPLLAPLLRPGAVVVSEVALDLPGWLALPLPDGLKPGRHFLYRVE